MEFSAQFKRTLEETILQSGSSLLLLPLVRGTPSSSWKEGHAAAAQEDQDPQTMSNTTTAASLSKGEAVASSLTNGVGSAKRCIVSVSYFAHYTEEVSHM